MSLDDKDYKILELLKHDSSLTTSQISKKTAIPITTVHNRIRRLKQEKIIKFTIKENYNALGLPVKAMVLTTVSDAHKLEKEALKKFFMQFEEITHINTTTGRVDMILEVRAKSIEALNEFLTQKLHDVEGIYRTETLIVLNEI
jgi:DNA-binding Lrp family transcriptional regulator